MYTIGIDIGSTYTKYCIFNVESEECELYSEPTPVRQRDFFVEKIDGLRKKYGDCPVVSCGYGRKNVASDCVVSELIALAAGGAFCCDETDTILDVGGQDTKIICRDGQRVKQFFINEKCAAGCGMFLKNVLGMLGIPFESIDLKELEQPAIRLSSVCAVFAQSEIVELIADGNREKEIAYAVIVHILTRAKALIGKVYCEKIALSGGLTLIPGIGALAERIFKKRVIIPRDGAYMSAIGCARIAAKNNRS